VITANKALLASHGIALAGLAEEHGALLNYEAAVAGGIPVIKALRESLTGNTISRVYGIMNGTCNYILTKMEKEGLSFEALPQGSAASGLCRSRSGLRHRGQRHRPQAVHPDEPCLRNGDRRR
jgi:homoserine dehydrogenase